MKTVAGRLYSALGQRKTNDGTSKSVWIAFALLSVAFLSVIFLGIIGSWTNILWWAYAVCFAFVFIWLTFKMDKRALRWSKIIVLIGFLVLFPLVAANAILTYQTAAQNLVTSQEINYFRNLLGRSYNYTGLYQWENSKLQWNDSASMLFYFDPIQIYEYGQARCGGYAILYAQLCISQGYDARVVVSIFGDHVWTEVKLNGTWTRVDSSPTGASMTDNIGYPLFYEERWHTPPTLALAFENSSIVDVTSNYRSDGWSLLSLSTVIFVSLGAWLAICIGLIWKYLFRPLRESYSAQRKLFGL
jgi:nitrate reductase NapE component